MSWEVAIISQDRRHTRVKQTRGGSKTVSDLFFSFYIIYDTWGNELIPREKMRGEKQIANVRIENQQNKAFTHSQFGTTRKQTIHTIMAIFLLKNWKQSKMEEPF